MLILSLACASLAAAEPGSAQSQTSDPGGIRASYTNRLIREKSPYLLQHAHNPVDWYPWGAEAFTKARSENEPIFLSVGYSTCHWCHVMERESFENPEIAKLLNDGFVCIKVDREERPDVDHVYMTFVEATTGSGGWPMNVWLTPELKPFFGGTYFPPDKLSQVLARVSQAWREERDKLLASSESITRKLQKYAETSEPQSGDLTASVLDECYSQIKSNYDPRFGGFGDAPKFPRPVGLTFLLRYYARTGKQDSLDMVLHTLRKMAEGGTHDQLGGGFHRYSTDAKWHVPHFEKMLYDQAQLVCVCLEAFQITHEALFADTARDILHYVQRDLSGEKGQFFSAQDADSPIGGSSGALAEGAFYVWEKREIDNLLGAKAADVFNYYFGVESKGNVEFDPRGELVGKNVLSVSHTLEQSAHKFNLSAEQASRSLEDARERLLQQRARRPRPQLDDKTITAWNGLMISAFARAAQVLGDPAFLASAQRARSFIKQNCQDPAKGKLFRRFRAGEAAVDAGADDYAFLIQGLLDLYEASFETDDLRWAVALQNDQLRLFEDKSHGGFFTTTGSDTNLLLRMKEEYEGAEPAANSVSVLNLLRLAQMTDNQEFGRSAQTTVAAFGKRLHQDPGAMPQMLAAFGYSLAKPRQIVVAGKRGAADTQAMLRLIYQSYIPNKILLLADGGVGQQAFADKLEFMRDLRPIDGKATAFVCENYVCQLPTTNLAILQKQLSPRK